MLHQRMKKGKDEIICAERLSSIPFLKKHLQKTAFFVKKTAVLKKKLSTSEMKKLLHPSEISVKC